MGFAHCLGNALGVFLLLFWGLLACAPRLGWEAGKLAGWVVLLRRQGVLDGTQAGPGQGLSSGKRDMIFMDAAGSRMGSCFLPDREMAVCPGYFHISTEVGGVFLCGFVWSSRMRGSAFKVILPVSVKKRGKTRKPAACGRAAAAPNSRIISPTRSPG